MQLGDALLVGGDLRLQIGDVLRRVARGVGGIGEELAHGVLAEAPGLDQLERIDIDPFLLDGHRLGAHRARRYAADIGVMAARRDEEQKIGPALGEYRRDHGDVGKVRAAIIGRVQHPHIARLERVGFAQHRLDAPVHRAEMDGNMRGVRDQPPARIENGAGEVEPLLDVDRARGVLQRIAHLLGDRDEEIVEHFEQDRIGMLAGARFWPLGDAGEQ